MISQAQLEKKVADYLRKSQLVTDQLGSPITASELQAEMDWMARHTKQPEVLRELFAALWNDPFVIAECLARPILAERLVNDLTTSSESNWIGVLKSDARTRSHSQGPPIGRTRPGASFAKQDDLPPISDAVLWSAMCQGIAFGPYPSVRRISLNAGDEAGATNLHNGAYKLPEVSVPLDCTDDSWTDTTMVNVPDARFYHTAVWTGGEMIIWGGSNSNGGQVNSLNTGGRYSPRYGQLDGYVHPQCAARPKRSHGGVDRGRDDRLGRC